ncbi:MAG: ATP-binding cassette domain-containing protein, partial [Granulosicoccus sp.]
SGKSKLASILFGLETASAGDILLHDKPYSPKNPKQAIQRGVFLCARDRANNAIIPAFDIVDNTTLPFYARHSFLGFLGRSSQQRASEQMISQLSIVCQSASDGVTTLSGGNQQKVIIGRWLYQSPRLLLLDEPFQGVDIKSRRDIGQRIRHSAIGRATLVFVSEIDEALEIADRLVVLHEHSIIDVHNNGDVSVETLTAQMTGVSAAP